MRGYFNMLGGQMEDSISKYDVVSVVKKTRVKPFGEYKVANKGNDYLVVSFYVNNFGTKKLYLTNEEGENFIASSNSVSKLFNLEEKEAKDNSDYKKWENARKAWMDKSYVPVYLTHFYDYSGFPMIISKDSNAALVSDLRKTNSKFWLSKEYVHVDDIKSFFTSSLKPGDTDKKNTPSGAVSVRIPLWLAKKNSIFKWLSKNVTKIII